MLRGVWAAIPGEEPRPSLGEVDVQLAHDLHDLGVHVVGAFALDGLTRRLAIIGVGF